MKLIRYKNSKATSKLDYSQYIYMCKKYIQSKYIFYALRILFQYFGGIVFEKHLNIYLVFMYLSNCYDT